MTEVIIELGVLMIFIGGTTWMVYRGLVRLFEWLDWK